MYSKEEMIMVFAFEPCLEKRILCNAAKKSAIIYLKAKELIQPAHSPLLIISAQT